MQIKNNHIGRINIPICMVEEDPELVCEILKDKIVINANFNHWIDEFEYVLLDITKTDFGKVNLYEKVPFYEPQIIDNKIIWHDMGYEVQGLL